MFRYLEAIEELPADVRAPLLKVLDLFREEVAETVKKSDFEELKGIVARLAHSQEELAEAQKRTEQEIITLTKEFKAFKRQLGGVTDTIGYTLENEAFKALPAILDTLIELKLN